MDFLETLAKVLHRVTKKNCLEVISPLSADKNWWFDPLFIFMGSTDQIQNANKSTNFPLDNCFNKRVLFSNEPNFEGSFADKLLMLFAGDPISDQGKYKNVAQIVCTPVIVTGNNPRFGRDKKWMDRMFRYRWKSCDWLKNINSRLKSNDLCTFIR